MVDGDEKKDGLPNKKPGLSSGTQNEIVEFLIQQGLLSATAQKVEADAAVKEYLQSVKGIEKKREVEAVAKSPEAIEDRLARVEALMGGGKAQADQADRMMEEAMKIAKMNAARAMLNDMGGGNSGRDQYSYEVEASRYRLEQMQRNQESREQFNQQLQMMTLNMMNPNKGGGESAQTTAIIENMKTFQAELAKQRDEEARRWEAFRKEMSDREEKRLEAEERAAERAEMMGKIDEANAKVQQMQEARVDEKTTSEERVAAQIEALKEYTANNYKLLSDQVNNVVKAAGSQSVIKDALKQSIADANELEEIIMEKAKGMGLSKAAAIRITDEARGESDWGESINAALDKVGGIMDKFSELKGKGGSAQKKAPPKPGAAAPTPQISLDAMTDEQRDTFMADLPQETKDALANRKPGEIVNVCDRHYLPLNAAGVCRMCIEPTPTQPNAPPKPEPAATLSGEGNTQPRYTKPEPPQPTAPPQPTPEPDDREEMAMLAEAAIEPAAEPPAPKEDTPADFLIPRMNKMGQHFDVKDIRDAIEAGEYDWANDALARMEATKLNPHTCYKCSPPKRYSSEAGLKNHMKTHTKDG